MTIRYTCVQCGVVMKIKDEKAGTGAKCPKCRAAFVVPGLEEGWDGELEFEPPAEDDDEAPLPNPAAAAGRAAKPEPRPQSGKPRAQVQAAAPDDDEADEEVRDTRGDDDDDADDDYGDQGHADDDDADDDYADEDDADAGGTRRAAETTATADEDDEDLDLPLELTPEVTADDAFDPTDVLGAPGSAPTARRSAASAAQPERKASVADLMRDFESTRKTDRRTSEPPQRTPVPSAVATAGTAAEALSRAYQQKRENASNPKAKQPEVNVERQLLIAWLIRSVPPVLLTLLLAYGLYAFMTRSVYSGPPLAPVQGMLTRSGDPLPGHTVRLVPVFGPEEADNTGGKNSAPGRSTASAVTDDQGHFEMMYTVDVAGAALGDHTLEIVDPLGLGVAVPPEYQQQTVPPEGIESLRIDLP